MNYIPLIRLSAVAAVLTFILLPGVSTAQQAGWSTPKELSGTTQSSWFPDVAAAPDGSVHVVWASGLAKNTVEESMDLLMYTAQRNGAWSAPNDVNNTGTGGFAARSSIVADSQGFINVLVRSQMRVDFVRAPELDAESFRAWTEPRKINNTSTPYYNALGRTSDGKLHALWVETVTDSPGRVRETCPNCADVFYRSSTDNGATWSSPWNMSQSAEGSMKPQLKIATDDTIHVVWEEGYDTLVAKGSPTAGAYRRSRDGGTRWDTTVRFVLPATASDTGEVLPDAPKQMTLGLYKGVSPIVVYRSSITNRVYFQRSTDDGTTWEAPQVFESIRARELNDTPWDAYAMATDSAGNVHLVLSGFVAGEATEQARPELLHLIWNGKAWSTPEVIAQSQDYADWSAVGNEDCRPAPVQTAEEAARPANLCQRLQRYPEWPRIAVGEGNVLHVVWFTRNVKDRYTSDNAAYQVWYSTTLADAPARPAVALPQPTVAPSPVPTVTQEQPTAMPLPTLSPEAVATPPIRSGTAWEGPGMLVIGMAALPVMGFLGMLIVRQRLRQRS